VNAANYWRDVGAPKARARKAELGRSVSNSMIAAAVETASGKSTSRQLVEEWFKGEREPYVSQLVALCEHLGLELSGVLNTSSAPRIPVRRVKEGARVISVQRAKVSVRK
jgi:hypothetical protein